MVRTVLVVDDMAFVRKTISDILTEAHYQVLGEAKDGQEAIDLYVKLRPDVVTMDVVMPQMSGIEAARKIIKIDKDAKVIILSAMGQENLIMEAIHAGAKDFVLKPFNPEDLLKAIARLFESESNIRGRSAHREK